MAEHTLTEAERETLWEASGCGNIRGDFDGVLAAVEAILAARLARVEALHQPPYETRPLLCPSCGVPAPCPTLAALAPVEPATEEADHG